MTGSTEVTKNKLRKCNCKIMVTCKIKHLQKCFRAVDFPQLCLGHKNVVKMFHLTRNHLLSSTGVQHAKTFAKNVYSVVFYFTCNHL